MSLIIQRGGKYSIMVSTWSHDPLPGAQSGYGVNINARFTLIHSVAKWSTVWKLANSHRRETALMCRGSTLNFSRLHCPGRSYKLVFGFRGSKAWKKRASPGHGFDVGARFPSRGVHAGMTLGLASRRAGLALPALE